MDLFREMDTDRSGVISEKEFRQALQELGFALERPGPVAPPGRTMRDVPDAHHATHAPCYALPYLDYTYGSERDAPLWPSRQAAEAFSLTGKRIPSHF